MKKIKKKDLLIPTSGKMYILQRLQERNHFPLTNLQWIWPAKRIYR